MMTSDINGEQAQKVFQPFGQNVDTMQSCQLSYTVGAQLHRYCKDKKSFKTNIYHNSFFYLSFDIKLSLQVSASAT